MQQHFIIDEKVVLVKPLEKNKIWSFTDLYNISKLIHVITDITQNSCYCTDTFSRQQKKSLFLNPALPVWGVTIYTTY